MVFVGYQNPSLPLVCTFLIFSIFGLIMIGNLQELILSDNPALTYVPEYTCFPKLQVLKLRNLQLPCVDPSIQVLVNLRELELRSNAHMGGVPDELGKLVSLTSKFFSFVYSVSFFSLLNLLELDLYGNKLKVIPGAIGSCVKLEILDLRNNLLTIESMPRQFANLVNLKKILLANNKLESIPEECFLLKGLEELDCSNNELHSLPDAIGTLVNLRKLQVSFFAIYHHLFIISLSLSHSLRSVVTPVKEFQPRLVT